MNASVKRYSRPPTPVLIAIGLVAILSVLPFWTNGYVLSNYRDVLFLGLFALSLDFFWGRTGILSFGHATFFGLGAYGMAITTIQFDIDPAWASLVGLAAGILLAAVVALFLGYFILYGGVRGAYFTIVTLALTLIASHVAVGWPSVTGGDSGLIGVPPLTAFGYTFYGPAASYYLALSVLAMCLFGAFAIMNGRFGLVLKAIQDDETKARTLGYKTQWVLLKTFVASAAMAGLAGALYVTGTGFVAPDLIALLLSTEVIIWVAVGGSGTLVGAVIGTMIVWQLQVKISSISFAAWPIAIGVFFIAMVLVFPEGPAAWLLRRLGWLRKLRKGDSQ